MGVGGNPQEDKYPTTRFSLSEVNQITLLSASTLCFRALFPLEAETSKMNATPSR